MPLNSSQLLMKSLQLSNSSAGIGTGPSPLGYSVVISMISSTVVVVVIGSVVVVVIAMVAVVVSSIRTGGVNPLAVASEAFSS